MPQEERDTRDEMLTPEQAAEWLQASIGSIYNWIANGKLPSLRVGRMYRIPRREVEAMVKQSQEGEDRP